VIRGVRLIEDLVRDIRHAVRQLTRSPRFTIFAVLCLGLGIGANTSMFALLNAVVLRPMEGADSERLVMLSRGQSGTFSYPAYRDYEARSRVFAAMAVSLPMESDLDVDGGGEFVAAEVVSANYADVLGIRPSLGRWFTNDVEPMAVISHAVWQRRFDGRPDVLGQQIRSESQSYTVVAVAPSQFIGVFAPLRTDIWVPLRTRPALAARLEDRGQQPLFMLFGRLRPDATTVQATAELNAIDQQLVAEHGSSPEIASRIAVDQVRGVPHPGTRRTSRTVATLLTAVVAVVLLIACVNVGNLLLVRGAVRGREFAVRRALGGTRLRVVRQLLTENLVLAVAGGICGVVLARWINQLLERSLLSLASGFGVQLNLSLDWRVLVFTMLITLATTLLCGLLPAWRTSETRGLVPFKSEISVGGRRRGRPFGVIAQIGMSLALLLIAGTFLQAVLRLQATDPGFAVADRLYAYTFIPTPPFTPESGRQFYSQAVERLRELPGVQNAVLSYFLPLVPARSDCAAGLEGNSKVPVTTGVVDSGFLGTMDIDLVSGRDFSRGDSGATEPVVIVNESLAGQLWPNKQPIGEQIMIGCRDSRRAVVVGVVRNSAVRSLGERTRPHLFRPFAQHYSGGLTTIVVETRTSAAAMVEPVRQTLRELGQGIRVYTVQSMNEHVEQSYRPIRWQASILTAFGVLALFLAAIGLYSVIAYRATLRTPEIGVRMALGASRRDVFREVIGQGLSIVLIGVALGELLALTLAQVLASLQPDIRPPGPLVYVGTAMIWIAVALLATYPPAARASRTSPLVALRSE
jgi:putative ABC transport system permease protein